MQKHPKIEYPCEWEYRIIGTSEELIRKAIIEIIGSKKYDLSFSNKSKAGKYVSLSLKTFVTTENERNTIYVSLRNNIAIKSVI